MDQTKRVLRRFNGRKFVLFCLSTVLLLATVTTVYFYVFLESLHGGDPAQVIGRDHPEPSRHESINVLIIGEDVGVVENPDSGAPGRTDTMLVATLDPEKPRAGVISIPRDSRVRIAGWGTDKINAAHVYGGVDLCIRTVESILNIPIHYYVKIDYQGLRSLVDALGGVKVDIGEDMRYKDHAGNLYIDISAGSQTLDGAKAEQFLRFRDRTTGDLGRILRQQQFVKALAKEVFSLGTVFKIPELAKLISENVETNMAPSQIVTYATAARHVDVSAIPMETLVGIDRYIDDISYYIVDEPAVGAQVARVLMGIDREANSMTTIEVLNGSGSVGAAGDIAAQLADMGYSIGDVGNASHFDYKESTLIYAPSIAGDAVNNVSRALNIDKLIKASDSETRNADITVIVGRDLT